MKSFEQIEDLGLATPDDRQAKVADYNAATESGSRWSDSRASRSSLKPWNVRSRRRPKAKSTRVQKPSADQVITTRTLPARLLAGYSEDALAADHDMGLGVVFRSLLPCVLLASLLFWWLVGQLLEQIRAVKSYAERLSGGDLSEESRPQRRKRCRVVLPKRSIPFDAVLCPQSQVRERRRRSERRI